MKIDKKVKFIDEKKFLAEIDIKVNGDGVFTASGNYGGECGQVLGGIVPKTSAQSALIDFHKENHCGLLGVEKLGLLELIINDLENEWYFDRKNDLASLSDVDLLRLCDDDERLCAIVKLFKVCDLDEVEIDGCRITVQGVDYLFGTDDEMDDLWEDELNNYLEECVYFDLPEISRRYFDVEGWKVDARMDGRGHSLGRYDGREESITFMGVDYYAYKQ